VGKLISLETVGFRDALGKFAKAQKEVVRINRELVREAGRLYIGSLRDEAPGERLPNSFSFKTFERATGLDLRVYSSDPNIQYVIKETAPHEIVGAPYLAFFWTKVGKKMVLRRVQHPGTKANPFHERAYTEVEDKFVTLINKAGARFLLIFR